MRKILEKILFKDGILNWELLFKSFVFIVVVIMLAFMFFDVIPRFIESQS